MCHTNNGCNIATSDLPYVCSKPTSDLPYVCSKPTSDLPDMHVCMPEIQGSSAYMLGKSKVPIYIYIYITTNIKHCPLWQAEGGSSQYSLS